MQCPCLDTLKLGVQFALRLAEPGEAGAAPAEDESAGAIGLGPENLLRHAGKRNFEGEPILGALARKDDQVALTSSHTCRSSHALYGWRTASHRAEDTVLQREYFRAGTQTTSAGAVR